MKVQPLRLPVRTWLRLGLFQADVRPTPVCGSFRVSSTCSVVPQPSHPVSPTSTYDPGGRGVDCRTGQAPLTRPSGFHGLGGGGRAGRGTCLTSNGLRSAVAPGELCGKGGEGAAGQEGASGIVVPIPVTRAESRSIIIAFVTRRPGLWFLVTSISTVAMRSPPFLGWGDSERRQSARQQGDGGPAHRRLAPAEKPFLGLIGSALEQPSGYCSP